MMPALFSFLHHLGAFALVSALAIQLVLLREALNLPRAQTIRRIDRVYGVSALLVLVAGLLRVFYFEKGAAFYFGNSFFIAKLALFVIVGLLSIHPTREYLLWGRMIKAGRVPALDAGKLRRLRRVVHWQLVGLLLLIVCAALMAHGVDPFQ